MFIWSFIIHSKITFHKRNHSVNCTPCSDLFYYTHFLSFLQAIRRIKSALPSISHCHLVVYRTEYADFIAAPQGCKQLCFVTVARNAFDDRFGRQHLQLTDYDAHIVLNVIGVYAPLSYKPASCVPRIPSDRGACGTYGLRHGGLGHRRGPEFEIENAKALAKAGNDPKKLKKVKRKKAPEGFVTWNENTFDKLIDADPETLVPHMKVTHSMVLNEVEQGGDARYRIDRLIDDSAQTPEQKERLHDRADEIFQTLFDTNVIERKTAMMVARTIS